jgi:hypothetical protein
VGWCGPDRSGLGQEQVESPCECDNEPSVSQNGGKLSSGYTTIGLSSSAQRHRVS